jgi:hypothetical protein
MTGIIMTQSQVFAALKKGIWIVPRFPTVENGETHMRQTPIEKADTSTFKLPTYTRDRLYHILLGDYAALMDAINRMAVTGYCDRAAWMMPVPTGRSGEYISVMTRRSSSSEG